MVQEAGGVEREGREREKDSFFMILILSFLFFRCCCCSLFFFHPPPLSPPTPDATHTHTPNAPSHLFFNRHLGPHLLFIRTNFFPV